MADNYLQFSEVLPNLTKREEAWLEEQLQSIRIFNGQEYPEDAVPPEMADKAPDWTGVRFLRGWPGYDPDCDPMGFQYAFDDDEARPGHKTWGRHLWLYVDDYGDVEHVAQLVQKFLKRFRPQECWSLTYAATCSKPRVGEFGGGAVFVTAKGISWENVYDFIAKKRKAFDKRPQASPKKPKKKSR